MLTNLIHFIYILSLVCWIGSVVFFSFFAAPVIFKVLDREQAGEVVGVLFPRYYFIGYVCAALALATLLLGAQTPVGMKLVFLLIMMAGLFCAGLIVSPKARKLKAKIKSAASSEEREPLEGQFKTMHSLAVKLNGAVLLAGLGLLWLSAAGLKL
ncbi:MAG: DUF4149 domain-containing protein [Nitrospinae bacterium]|nr:DUF4149 domain-containing protein [Nitrospinota bacterium]